MKTKLPITVLAILTVCSGWSQDTSAPFNFSKVQNFGKVYPGDTTGLRPVTFPFWMVREIALDLEEKQQLELEKQLYALEVEAYQKLLESMEEKEQKRQLQLKLLDKNISHLEAHLGREAICKRHTKNVMVPQAAGALGAGFVLGRL